MRSRQRKRWRRRVSRLLRRLAIFYIGVLLPLRVLFVWGFRGQVRPILDAVRAFNKWMLNPVMLRLAGRRGWYAAVVHHTGRRSGRAYATPVWAEPIPDGLLIPLPYGTRVDWLQNILAAGSCRIEAKGSAYSAVQPEVVEPTVAQPLLPAWPGFIFRLYGVKHYLRLRTVRGSDEPETAASGDQDRAPRSV